MTDLAVVPFVQEVMGIQTIFSIGFTKKRFFGDFNPVKTIIFLWTSVFSVKKLPTN